MLDNEFGVKVTEVSTLKPDITTPSAGPDSGMIIIIYNKMNSSQNIVYTSKYEHFKILCYTFINLHTNGLYAIILIENIIIS